jgi:hypothetical protein
MKSEGVSACYGVSEVSIGGESSSNGLAHDGRVVTMSGGAWTFACESRV